MLVIKTQIHKMCVRIAIREDPDQTASSEAIDKNYDQKLVNNYDQKLVNILLSIIFNNCFGCSKELSY